MANCFDSASLRSVCAGRMLGRNYRNDQERRRQHSKAIFILVPSGIVTFVILFIVSAGANTVLAVLLASGITLGITMLGVSRGKQERATRQRLWETEAHNEEFMEGQGFREFDDGTLADAEGNRYRIQGTYGDTIELFAIGRRNRRGYLRLDEQGRIVEWTGLTKLA